MQQPDTIFDRLFRPDNALIDLLMSDKGSVLLDQEILEMREEMGNQQFQAFGKEFFQDSNFDYESRFGLSSAKSTVEKSPNHEMQKQRDPQKITNFDKTNEEGEFALGFITDLVQTAFANGTVEPAVEQEVEGQYQQGRIDETNETEEHDDHEEIEKISRGEGKYLVRYRNGDIYEGEMEEGIKSGWGQYLYQSGQKYCGCFIEDEINGYGRYYFLSGAAYEGDWSSGMKHGIGILTFANKDIYEGSFCKDDLHGKGVYRYSNGNVFEGTWKKGLRNGPGVFEGTDGRYQKGNWRDDKFQVD